jgi:hypothetical protein
MPASPVVEIGLKAALYKVLEKSNLNIPTSVRLTPSLRKVWKYRE